MNRMDERHHAGPREPPDYAGHLHPSHRERFGFYFSNRAGYGKNAISDWATFTVGGQGVLPWVRSDRAEGCAVSGGRSPPQARPGLSNDLRKFRLIAADNAFTRGYFFCMTRLQLLAAEIFSYSFANYASHLGIGHVRFEQLMPNAARQLERAEKEGWTDARLAQALDVELAEVPLWRKRFRDAVEVVDAPNPAEAFRNAVRQALEFEFAPGPAGDAKIESAVKQVCYRAADLAFLLQQNGATLAQYSAALRREDDDDDDESQTS